MANNNSLTAAYENLPKIAKILLQLFFGWLIGGVYRIEAQEMKLPIGRKYFINVGSVGQPRDGDPRCAYALYDTAARTVRFRRLEYDIEAAQRRIREAGLPERLAERLALGQ